VRRHPPSDPHGAGAPAESVLLATREGDTRVRAEPFAEVELDLAPLWTEGA
jgi:hypothetical protein